MSVPVFPILACGDDALRIACGPGAIRHHFARHLSGFHDWLEIVPGKEDVTVLFDVHAVSMSEVVLRLEAQLSGMPAGDDTKGVLHHLPAVFGGEAGPDLAQLSAGLDVPEQALIDAVVSSEFIVDLIGFTPGFSYLSGLPPIIRAERLTVPRVRVPAGSIGVLTGQAGLYALEGPGGWPLIGRVSLALFDPLSDKPLLLAPGDRVRFVREAPR